MPRKSKKKWKIVATIAVLVVAFLAAASVVLSVQQFGLVSGRGLAERIIIVSLLAFSGSLLAFGAIRYEEGVFLEKGEIRSAIAIALTVAYLILLPLSLVPNIGLDFGGEFLKNFHLVYVSVIGFYFGTRVVEILRGKEES